MPEILTESFCERCGTRYTFESARPKVRLKGVKVLSRGLKNFVLSDDTTMDEAMAAARSETDREVTAHQLDAFHKTFSFCMSCRQYTCPNCWNEVEARCQSCAPLAMPEIAPAAFPGLMTLAEATLAAEHASNGTNGHDLDATAAEATQAVAAEAVVVEPEVVEAEAVAAEAAAEPAAKAIGQTASLLRRFRPGQSLDEELAAFERERSGVPAQIAESQPDEVTTPPATEAVAATEMPAIAEEPVETRAEEPVQVIAAEPVEVTGEEPVMADLEPEPVAVARAEPEPVAPPAADVVEQPTWRITAPDVEAPAIGMPAPGDATIPAQAHGRAIPSAEPQWPARPEWPAPQASVGLPFLGRPAQPQGGVESLWAASNRELVSTPPIPGRQTSGIQPCISCGLSLSATARFCRRCGTLQGG